MKPKKTKNINKWSFRGRTIWEYTKYQIFSKIILAVVLLPLYSLFLGYLTNSRGMSNISSGDFMEFLLSAQGFLAIVSGLVVLIIILGIDINSFIVISAFIQERKKKIKIREVFHIVVKNFKKFISPIGIVVALYIAIIFPIINIGISLTPFKELKIPNFVESVIMDTPKYLAIYSVLLIVLSIVSLVYVFTLHYMIIGGKSIGEALKCSRNLIKRYWKRFLWDSISAYIKPIAGLGLILIVLTCISVYTYYSISDGIVRDFSSILSILTVSEIIGYVAFISIPYSVGILTELFYKYNLDSGEKFSIVKNTSDIMSEEDLKSKIRISTKLKVLFLLFCVGIFNVFSSFFTAVFFDQIFMIKDNIQIVAHRAGGDLAAENTVLGVQKAYESGAKWTEIDVQRTKDGKYIINHDSTFSRVSGVNKKSKDMTFDEIKKLRVRDLFDTTRKSQPVATLDDILSQAKSKIGVFVEFKGETADKKMVDDVVKIIRAHKMEKECVLLSLDYNIIKYIEEKYPSMETGYLYYFTTGNPYSLFGDYLIMEEREATDEKIEEIHQAKKKAIVWTVNTESSAEKFLNKDIDGLITDHVEMVKKVEKDLKNRDHFDILIDNFIE